MLRVIPEEKIAARTQAMRAAIPKDKRGITAEAIRRYADDMDARYRQLAEFFRDSLGDVATEVILKEMNTPKFDWERSVANRLEGKRDDWLTVQDTWL